MSARELITEHLDLWTGAVTKKSTSGRGSNGKTELTGVKKLRELILELAVHGKLVEQYSADTPADQLLERIAERRNELISSKKIKNSKPLPTVTPDEAPSELPVGWVWTRLGSIAEINPRNLGDDTLEASFIPMPLVTTSYHGEHGEEPHKWGDIKKGYSHFANGDVGLAKITPCFENSKAAVFRHLRNGIGAGTTELHVARPLSPAINPYFLLLFLKSPRFLTEGEKVMTGSAGQKRVPKGYFSETPLPLPPEEEQHRIVQKVDELMALCDRLEQQTSDQLEAHETLVDTLLGTLTQSETATELADNWARLAAHFDTLFSTEQSIDKLKQTILQLAVMGRLVEQDAGDESAQKLITKLSVAKTTLIKDGKLKKSRKLPDITDGEAGITLPSGWLLTRLGDAYDVRDGTHDSPKYETAGYPLITSKNLSSGELSFDDVKLISESDHKKIQERSRVRQGDILFAMIGSIGNPVIVNTNREFSIKNVALFKYYSDELSSPSFLKLFLENAAEDLKQQAAGGVQSFVSLGKLRSWLMPLPPLAEQHRIVQKVDELMALCDQLKERLNQAGETRCQLAEAVVASALG